MEKLLLWSKVGFHGKDALGRQYELGTIRGYNTERFDLTTERI
jgi:hypothetical protein